MSSLIQDLKYALRTFVKSPGFAAVAVITLALGIGANAAIFALVDRVLLRFLPVHEPGRLVLLRSPGPSQGHTWSDADDAASFSYPMYRDLRDGATVFSGLLAEFPFDASVAARGETDRAAAELVSGNYFDVLGVPPALGRTLTPGDDRAPGAGPVAVLSYGYWTRRLGGDPSVLNRTIQVDGQPLTVVGVARSGFSGIQPGRPADLFVPMMMKARMTPGWNGLDDPKDYWVQIVGRLRPGLSAAQAETAVQSTYRPLLQAALAHVTGWKENDRREFVNRRLLLVPGGHGRNVLREGVGTPLLSLMGMVALVLLIACSNLAGLLAARGAARQREYGIRLAIGANRLQLLRQSLVECLLFAAAGGAVGVLIAGWTLQLLLSAFPAEDGMRQIGAQIDPRVLGFAAILSLVAGLLFGVSPALRAARLDPARTLRGQGRGTTSASSEVLRLRRWLVTGQVALTLVLLVAAGLFVRTLRNLAAVDLGLKPDPVIGFSIAPDQSGYSRERTAVLARNLADGLAALPGVRSVTGARLPTLASDTAAGNVNVEGVPPPSDNSNHIRRNWIGPDYFATLGIPLVAGREISWRDDAAAPKVAVVNEAFVRKFLSGRNPLGVRLVYGAVNAAPDTEIVGVVGDSKSAEVSEREAPFVYLSLLQDPRLGPLTFYLCAERSPESLIPAIRSEVARLDRHLPTFDVRSLRTQIRDSLVAQRLIMGLSMAFGVLAALLAALGIYGVLAYAVAQRRQEIGVRIALGARPNEVRRLILGEVGRFLAAGAAIGVPAAYALGRAMESILFGVHAADAGVFAVGLLLLAGVSLAAAYPPALRAARTNPMEALKSE